MQRHLAFVLALLLVLVSAVPAPARAGTPRIVGGQAADPGEWPWQVQLDVTDGANVYLCGGSILAATWVVTAAHCVLNEQDQPLPAANISGWAGIHDLNVTAGAQRLHVAQVIVHESYNPVSSDNDIALLRLSTPLVIGPKVHPVPLVPASVGTLEGATAWVTGWGATSDNGPSSDVLMEVAVPVVSNATCETWYDSSQGADSWITQNMLCAGYMQGGKDACQGDSGGPLVVDRSGNGLFELAGVVSWGMVCAGTEQPGVYTRVSRLVPSMSSKMGAVGPVPASSWMPLVLLLGVAGLLQVRRRARRARPGLA